MYIVYNLQPHLQASEEFKESYVQVMNVKHKCYLKKIFKKIFEEKLALCMQEFILPLPETGQMLLLEVFFF